MLSLKLNKNKYKVYKRPLLKAYFSPGREDVICNLYFGIGQVFAQRNVLIDPSITLHNICNIPE